MTGRPEVLEEFPVPGAPALLVLPGGGFREHTAHDGEGYARWLNAIGLGAVVLNHELRPDPFPRSCSRPGRRSRPCRTVRCYRAPTAHGSA